MHFHFASLRDVMTRWPSKLVRFAADARSLAAVAVHTSASRRCRCHISFALVMFFLVQRKENVALSPKYFGKNLAADVEEALRVKVEGKCSGRYGFTSQ
jgi:hypothetical protein